MSLGTLNLQSHFFRKILREIQQERSNPKDPVELTEIKVREKSVRIKEKFTEDSEWIKKTTFKLRNKFSKTISYVQVNIDFPETEASGVMFQQQLFLGRHPVDGEPSNQQPLILLPNNSLDVSLDLEFASIKKMIERRHGQ